MEENKNHKDELKQVIYELLGLKLNWNSKDEKYDYITNCILLFISFSFMIYFDLINRDIVVFPIKLALYITSVIIILNIYKKYTNITSRVVEEEDINIKQFVGSFPFTRHDDNENYVSVYTNGESKFWYTIGESSMIFNKLNDISFSIKHKYYKHPNNSYKDDIYILKELNDINGGGLLYLFKNKKGEYYVMSYNHFKKYTRSR